MFSKFQATLVILVIVSILVLIASADPKFIGSQAKLNQSISKDWSEDGIVHSRSGRFLWNCFLNRGHCWIPIIPKPPTTTTPKPPTIPTTVKTTTTTVPTDEGAECLIAIGDTMGPTDPPLIDCLIPIGQSIIPDPITDPNIDRTCYLPVGDP